MNKLKRSFTIKSFTVLAVPAVALLAYGSFLSWKKSQNEKQPQYSHVVRITKRAKNARNCDDFSKEERSKQRWTTFFEKCKAKKTQKVEIVTVLKNNQFEIVKERTHDSVRLHSIDKGCYNKTLVFTLFFKNNVIDQFEFKYGVVAID